MISWIDRRRYFTWILKGALAKDLCDLFSRRFPWVIGGTARLLVTITRAASCLYYFIISYHYSLLRSKVSSVGFRRTNVDSTLLEMLLSQH